ncbi:MAG TPA: hypothetical protein VN279_07045, partial [Rhodocyclaceae bacterium]|nr:hypothetical protein [Rhodocyclaceae bacterium]
MSRPRKHRPFVVAEASDRQSLREGMLRTGPLMALPALLRSFGADPARLLDEFGLDAAFFDDPEN